MYFNNLLLIDPKNNSLYFEFLTSKLELINKSNTC